VLTTKRAVTSLRGFKGRSIIETRVYMYSLGVGGDANEKIR
jgi:hypothetical protein